jgi:hypothetical protein
MKRVGNSVVGILLIVAAAYLVVHAFGIQLPGLEDLNISVFQFCMLLFCASCLIHGLSELDWGSVVFGGFLGYYFLAQIINLPKIPIWTAILAAILLSAGLEKLFHKRGKFRFRGADGVEHEYDDFAEFKAAMKSEPVAEGEVDMSVSADDYLEHRVIASTLNKYVVSRGFRGGEVEVVFGCANLYFDRVKMAEEAAMLHSTVTFGTMNVYVPQDWAVCDRASRYFASKNDSGEHAREGAPTLIIDGECIFGRINIIRI